jgi:hypothetical protein
MGLAKTSYVDEVKLESDRARAEVDALSSQVREMRTIADQMEALIDDMEATRRATAELQQLAEQVTGRLEALPRETLRRLADLIESYLQE